MRLSDLQNKDVVDVKTGEKIGNVNILNLIIYEKKGLLNIIRGDEVTISWNQIKKIGTDVILVNKNI